MQTKTEIKQQIRSSLEEMRKENIAVAKALNDRVLLTDYRLWTEEKDGHTIWTAALQRALREHSVVVIPPAEAVYWIDDTVVIPSDRHIEATGATIRLTLDCEVLMLRNEHTADGTFAPIEPGTADHNISIHGGRWEESHTKRGGYGRSGRYTHFAEDKPGERRPFYGVSTCMLFNNLTGLTLRDVTFAHTAGFGVQVGNLTNGVFEHITFESCYADGLHINGNSTNLYVYNIRGEVGDDLVALNMYDWQNSSVTFGPTHNVLCEELHLAQSSLYKALRIEPGIYTYADGSTADCGLSNAIISHVTGIMTFKMYFQTPAYRIGTEPERGGVGSSDNLFFEHITVDLAGPIDRFASYLNSDPIRGHFAAFELGSHIGYVSFTDIDLTLHRDIYPLSYLVMVGPKSIRNGDTEVFDPYLTSHVGTIELQNIRVNGEVVQQDDSLVCVTKFADVNEDGHSTGCGTVQEVRWS